MSWSDSSFEEYYVYGDDDDDDDDDDDYEFHSDDSWLYGTHEHAEEPPGEDFHERASDEITFTKKADFTDMTLVVEDQKLYFNQELLSMASPVLKEALKTQNYQATGELVIDDSTVEEITDMLRWILPLCPSVITKSNAMTLISVAAKYRMDPLLEACYAVIEGQRDERRSIDSFIHLISIAKKHGLSVILGKTVDALSEFDGKILNASEKFKDLPVDIREQIFKKKVNMLERRITELTCNGDHLILKHVQCDTPKDKLKDFVKNMEVEATLLEKQFVNLKNTLCEIREVWHKSLPSEMCSNHPNIAGVRDYTCHVCNKEFGYFLLSKVPKLESPAMEC